MKSIIQRRLCSTGSTTYAKVFARSITTPEDFWGEAAQGVTWFKKWDRVLKVDPTRGHGKWFEGGKLNVCYNAVDRHVENGFGDAKALLWESPITSQSREITFKELQNKVSRLAGCLSRKFGVKKGDTILIYMPMIKEAIVTMLACSRLGAVHTLVFGGFAAPQLASRIVHAQPKLIVLADYGIEPGPRKIDYLSIMQNAVQLANTPDIPMFVFQREKDPQEPLQSNGTVFSWKEELAKSEQGHDAVEVDANHPMFLLYTSGTTGSPKAPMRECGGYTVALHWSMKHLYGVSPGESWWAGSDLGWIVGQSYSCYAPLLHRNATVLFEGKPVGTPDCSVYPSIIEKHKIVSFFTAPTAIRAIRQVDPQATQFAKRDLSHLRSLFVAGEICDEDTLEWCRNHFKCPVYNHYWQTESGWPITTYPVGLHDDKEVVEVRPKSIGKPVPGYDIKIIDPETALPVEEAGQLGDITVKLPLPPGTFTTLYKDDEKFQRVYFSKFPGYYDTLDSGYMDADGFVFISGRTDDVINVSAHRLTSGQLEEAVSKVKGVLDCAVVAFDDELKGSVPLAFVVATSPSLKQAIMDNVRKDVGAIASLVDVIFIEKLPKTRSGKTSRLSLTQLINGKQYSIPVTIEDATVFASIHSVVMNAAGVTFNNKVSPFYKPTLPN